MSNEEDQCFQCQELGHIACHCPHIRYFECDEYDHIAADCPDKIPPSGMPAHHKRHHSNTRHHTRSTFRHHHRDWHSNRGPDHSHIPTDIKVIVIITQTEATPDHVTEVLTGALHITITPALIIIAATHHTGNHLHIEAPPLILEIAADPEHVPHTNQVRPPPSKPSSSSSRTTVSYQDKEHRRVIIDDPQSDYYSPDDTTSDSEDDLN